MKKFYSSLFASLFSMMLVTAAPTTGLQFSGVATSYIDLGQQAAFSPTQFTIEAWVNYQSLTGAYILSTEGSAAASGGNQGYVLRLSGSKLQLSMGSNAAWPELTGTTDLQLNTWYHIAATYSGTEINLYINGVLDASSTTTTPMVTSVQNVCIGEGSMWKSRLFTGQMADLRFWNVVRTASEIAGSMSTSLIGTEAGLVADWKMNEGAGTVVSDATGDYNITKPADVTWFGLINAVNSVLSDKIKTTIIGKNLTILNNYASSVNVSIYTLSGQKLFENIVNAGGTINKKLNNLTGVFVLRYISEDGYTHATKFVLK